MSSSSREKSDEKTTVTDRGNIGPMSTAVTCASGNFSALSIALLYPKEILHMRTLAPRQKGRERTISPSPP
jgi:hypothetical protein